ncbi:MAG: hypothetical protein D6798_13485 [Deltaproteobacteria bacterium]|nr:MAG: hypothetical protein D6798_13485 [Deltaproteobacteria bacterium]
MASAFRCLVSGAGRHSHAAASSSHGVPATTERLAKRPTSPFTKAPRRRVSTPAMPGGGLAALRLVPRRVLLLVGEPGSRNPDVTTTRWLLSCAVLALLYVATGLAGLSLASVGSEVTLLWAPLGLSLGALIVGGVRMWPGVIAGSLAVNLINGSPPLESLLIAVGNTVGPLVGALALRRARFDPRLDTIEDLGKLLTRGVLLPPALTATIGTLALLTHGLPPSDATVAWSTWWLGDATGALVVTPLVLAWFGPARVRTLAALRRAPGESVAATVVVLAAAALGFNAHGPMALALMLVPFPAAFAVQLRLGTGLATGLVVGASILCIVADALGTGPLAGVGEVLHGLTWAYVAVLGGSVLGSAALQAERRLALARQRELESAALEAQRLEAIGVVAAGVAHDFNNLFQSIRGYAELAALKPGHAVYLDRITASVDRGAELCSELQHYAGQSLTQLERLEIPAVVSDIAALLSAGLPERVLLDLRLGEGDRPIRADRRQVEQVALNLVANAAEAQADAGGGIVRVVTGCGELEEADLAMAAVRSPDAMPGTYAWIEVSDSGPGIDPAIRPTIFEPFVTSRFIGRGLGLSAVAGIARTLGGAVFVHTAPGAGTRVRVAWPEAPDKAGGDTIPPGDEQPHPEELASDGLESADVAANG